MNMLPTTPRKLTVPKDMLNHLGTVANRSKNIKKYSLGQPGLGRDTFINGKPCKDPHIIGKPNKPNTVICTLTCLLDQPKSISHSEKGIKDVADTTMNISAMNHTATYANQNSNPNPSNTLLTSQCSF